VFSSSTPYAETHNKGEDITIKKKKKKFFWAKMYEAQGRTSTKEGVRNANKLFTKTGKRSNSKAAQKLNKQAEFYKSLALKKVGSKITIPQRQFIGEYPGMNDDVERIAHKVLENEIQAIVKKANQSP
jgi:hypothetical protein